MRTRPWCRLTHLSNHNLLNQRAKAERIRFHATGLTSGRGARATGAGLAATLGCEAELGREEFRRAAQLGRQILQIRMHGKTEVAQLLSTRRK
jgi:hypothetical protein